MKNLPIGIQTFSKLVEKDMLYIDKTEHIYNLINEGSFYFLSRPRRFGKSLLLSTIKSVFEGKKDLFKGLYIHEKVGWDSYPIIHLSMSSFAYSETVEIFKKDVVFSLNSIGRYYNIVLENNTISGAFGELLQKLSKQKKVVILIDEYDKPILDFITNLSKAKENREVLKEFYSVIKDNDEYIEFCFITGVSKFSKTSVFSGLNNLKDITIDWRYSTICGYTQDELDYNFADRFNYLDEEKNVNISELKVEIKKWYNGYSWDGEKKVYNPFSILNYFDSYRFDNYWFATGTPTFLVEKFKELGLKIEDVKEFKVGKLFFDSFDIEKMDYRFLLFQTGYLTIKKISTDGKTFTLWYPNNEVKDAFLAYIAASLVNKNPGDIEYINIRLRESLKSYKIDEFVLILKSLISGIPYNIHLNYEAYYHSMFYLIMELVGIDMEVEKSTIKGRIDGVIEFEDKIYIIEFKYLSDKKDNEKLLALAIEQIKTKEYFVPYLNKKKTIYFLAITINKDTIEYKIVN